MTRPLESPSSRPSAPGCDARPVDEMLRPEGRPIESFLIFGARTPWTAVSESRGAACAMPVSDTDACGRRCGLLRQPVSLTVPVTGTGGLPEVGAPVTLN